MRNQNEIKVGMWIETPRFCSVKIKALYTSEAEAEANGYTVSTYYDETKPWNMVEGVHDVLGHQLDLYSMEFAAVVAVDCIPETAARLRKEFCRANPGVIHEYQGEV